MKRFLIGLLSFVFVIILIILPALIPDTPDPRTVVHCSQYHHQETHLAMDGETATTHIFCVKNIPRRNK